MSREGWTFSPVTDPEALDAEARRQWRALPVGERLLRIRELSVMAYSAKGIRAEDGERLSRVDPRAE